MLNFTRSDYNLGVFCLYRPPNIASVKHGRDLFGGLCLSSVHCGDIPMSNMRTHLVSGSSYSKVTHGGKQRPEQYEEKLGKMMRRTGLELKGPILELLC